MLIALLEYYHWRCSLSQIRIKALPEKIILLQLISQSSAGFHSGIPTAVLHPRASLQLAGIE